MQQLILENLITIIFLVFAIYGFIKGFSEGLLKTLLSFGSIIITIIATKQLTPMLSNIVKDATNIESSLTSIIYDAFIKSNVYDSINIPPFIKSAIDTGNIEATIRDGLCTNIANAIINLVCGIVIFIVVMIVLKIILKILDVVDYIPLISQFNRLLGGVLGVMRVLLIVSILFTILRIFENTPQVKTITDNIKSSFITGYIYNNNVVYDFFSNLFTTFT